MNREFVASKIITDNNNSIINDTSKAKIIEEEIRINNQKENNDDANIDTPKDATFKSQFHATPNKTAYAKDNIDIKKQEHNRFDTFKSSTFLKIIIALITISASAMLIFLYLGYR